MGHRNASGRWVVDHRVEHENRHKLSFERRCAVLVLKRCGASAPTIAALFFVNVDTVRAIYRPSSSKYKEVRAHVDAIGPEEAWRRYVTRNMLEGVNRVQPGAIDPAILNLIPTQP